MCPLSPSLFSLSNLSPSSLSSLPLFPISLSIFFLHLLSPLSLSFQSLSLHLLPPLSPAPHVPTTVVLSALKCLYLSLCHFSLLLPLFPFSHSSPLLSPLSPSLSYTPSLDLDLSLSPQTFLSRSSLPLLF